MKRKRYISVLLASLLVFSNNVIPVFASEVDNTESQVVEGADVPTTRDTDVKFVEEPNFMVIVPKSIQLSSEKEAKYEITVKGTSYTGNSVEVKPEDNVADIEGVNILMSETNAKKG